MIYRALPILIMLMCLALPGFTLDLFVAPEGDDSNPGTREAPLQSLEKARDLIREYRADASVLPDTNIQVILREGRYFLEHTFELTQEDSGTSDAPVIYRAAEGESVYLDGGILLDPALFVPVTDASILNRLPVAVHDKIVQIDLGALGITDYGEFGPRGWGRPTASVPMELFVDSVPQSIARWPNEGSIPLGEVLAGGQDESDQPGVFRITTDRAERWQEAEDLYITGLFGVTWAHDMVGIAAMDLEAGTFTTRQPHSYGFRQPGFPSNFTTQYHVINLLEEIEVPGEYYLNRHTGLLYFYPPHPLDYSTIQVSRLAEPLIHLENVSHVHFEGLTLENGRDLGIVISGGTGARVSGCTLRTLGLRAITINGGNDHAVIASDIYHVGMGGIALNGGTRETLTPAGHVVRNCDIHRYNRWVQFYNPAVSVSGVGNRVEHSHMHHALHQAITFGGNEHVFEYNEIHHVLQDISDMGSIYVGRDPTFAGNIIRHNFFHHLSLQHEGGPGVQAIFFDDDTIYVALVYGNVFFQTGSTGVIKFHGGGGSSIVNNIAIDSPQLVLDGPGDVEGIKRAISKMLTDEPHQHGFPAKIEAMNIAEEPYRSRYPYIYETYAEGYNKGTPRWNNYEVSQDLSFFVDPENLDFTLREDAAVLEWVAEDVYDRVYGVDGEDIPFQAIPFDLIGLKQDTYRTTLGPMPFKKSGPLKGALDINRESGLLWWEPSHNADGYRVRIALDAELELLVVDTKVDKNYFEITDLEPSTQYYWQIDAIINLSRSNRGTRVADAPPWHFTTDHSE